MADQKSEGGQAPQGDMQHSSSEKHDQKSSAEKSPPTPTPPKKDSLPKRIWKKMDLNLMTLQLMFKGTVAPTIAIAIYQADSIAEIFTTIGYLAAVISILSVPIMPRAKFLMSMFLNLLAVCLGAAVNILAMYSVVKARQHTSPPMQSIGPGDSTSGRKAVTYNSSASAVAAIWLIVQVYIANCIRASRPQLALPVIMYSIFTVVSCITIPSFPLVELGLDFERRLLVTLLMGMGIAFGTSLFIFPKSCREVFFLQATGMVKLTQGLLMAQRDFVKSLETRSVFNPSGPEQHDDGVEDVKSAGANGANKNKHHGLFHGKHPEPPANPAAVKMKAMVAAAGQLQGKIYADMAFAKREVAWGKLEASDIDGLHKHFQNILLPVYGMASISDVFSRVADKLGWKDTDSSDNITSRDDSVKQWNEIMKKLHRPFEVITGAMVEGLQHTLLVLELEKPPKSKTKDVEATAQVVKPGDTKFSEHLKKRMDDFYGERASTLKEYLAQGPQDGENDDFIAPLEFLKKSRRQADDDDDGDVSFEHIRAHRQLFLVLYLEYLLWSTGQAVLKLAQYGDEKVEQGIMKKRRLINPGFQRLKKWIISAASSEDLGSSEQSPDAFEAGSAGIYAGASFQRKKDPGHLPPANIYEKVTDKIRLFSGLLGSSSSGFGLRAVCATFTVGIIAYLKDTQNFFREQRIVWALIMIAIGMTTTAGAGVFGFLGRIAGTVLAMVSSLIIWYIVVGHAPGVIVFLAVSMFCSWWVVIKQPRLLIIGILNIVTQVLILGYELQVQKVGIKVAVSNGQRYYPTSELAPYRLACVVGGMAVAFIWTFFPFTLSERSQMRRDMGAAMHLLANYYSVVHTSVVLRVQGKEGNIEQKGSPGHKLDKMRRQLWDKEMALIASLRQHAEFTRWEPTFGGKFPKETYDAIIDRIYSMASYIALISYSSATFSRLHSHEQSSNSGPGRGGLDPSSTTAEGSSGGAESWFKDFTSLLHSISPTSRDYTSTLTLLSGCLSNSLPLPPYLTLPPAYGVAQRMEQLDHDVLDVRHIQEPGYAAFAVMQVASGVVRDDLEGLIENVRSLLGEVDFEFHLHGSSEEVKRGEGRGKGGWAGLGGEAGQVVDELLGKTKKREDGKTGEGEKNGKMD